MSGQAAAGVKRGEIFLISLMGRVPMSKTIKIMLTTILLLLSLILSAGCSLDSGTPPSGSSQELASVEEVWEIIFQEYVEKDDLDADVLRQGAIRGMLEALDDPYTSYLDAETYKLGLEDLEGKIEGIGAQITMRDEQITVVAPIADLPADKAGIRAGDKILEIDGMPTSEMSLAEAVLFIRGPQGTSVRLLVLHQDEVEPEEIEIVRAEIEVTSVRFEMRGDIAYIRITNFSQRTDAELSSVLESLGDEETGGIILDLRSNPGGLLRTVVDVASHFLTEGVVVDVVDNQGDHDAMSVRRRGVTTDLPMVVLVNSFSASGSEVLAGALQDYARATIAGSRTFGKGSVNVLHELEDGSGLYITIARWLTPEGHLIEGEGITPDYELELDGEDAIQWAVEYLRGM